MEEEEDKVNPAFMSGLVGTEEEVEENRAFIPGFDTPYSPPPSPPIFPEPTIATLWQPQNIIDIEEEEDEQNQAFIPGLDTPYSPHKFPEE